MPTTAPDDDFLDGCTIGEVDHDPAATGDLVALFPTGDPAKADEWKALFSA